MFRPKHVLMIWLASASIAFSGAAHAYLDPGTGSILVQSLLAGIAGAVAVVSLYWHRLKTFFGNMRRSTRDAKSSAAVSSDNNNS